MELAVKQSPRKIAKMTQDTKYRVNLKEFSDILKDLTTRFSSLVALNVLLMAPSSKGLDLQVTEQNGNVKVLTRKDVKAANASFHRQLLDLKNYMRVSKKKQRTLVQPSSFTGTYIPAYAGEALKYFFNNGDFGPLDPENAKSSEKLMQKLPFVQKGYLLRNTTTMLFYIYTHQNKLQVEGQGQFTKPDALFKTAFNGKIPATYYVTKTSNGKQIKMLMNRAVLPEDEGGLDAVSAPMNTFSVITSGFGKEEKTKGKDLFTPDKLNVYYYQNIAALNYFSGKNLYDAIELAEYLEDKKSLDFFTEVKDHLGDEDPEKSYRTEMLKEHDIVKETSRRWKSLRKKEKEGTVDDEKEEVQKPVEEAKKSKVSPKNARSRK